MVEGLGPRWLSQLTEIFGSPEKVWFASEKELQAIPKLPSQIITDLLQKRDCLDPLQEQKKLADKGIRTVFSDEPSYPPLLREIYDPPKVLYIRGDSAVLQKPMTAIVGARKASVYGTAVAEKIAADLSGAGLCVVSGMARGIDSAAHRGALAAGAPTVAVLGCGVDVVYPPENKKLMADIIKSGAVISEFPPGTSPQPGNFPQRNRVISGLSLGVLVIEAAEKSGSLITADFALEQGRDVFAVPGQVTNKLNRGAHRLIKQGARLAESAWDILEELGWEALPPRTKNVPENQIELTTDEKRIYNVISDDPLNCEVVIERSGLQASEVLAALLLLEMKGLVRRLPGERFARCN